MSTKETNPKDALAADRVPLHLWPPVATAHGTMAMMVGAIKYGRNNWREAGVRASVYRAAMHRHMDRWFEGEDIDESGCHHLAHVLACVAILLDAQASGKLIDDRDEDGGYTVVMNELTKRVPEIRRRAEEEKRLQEYRNCEVGGIETPPKARVKRPSWGDPAETAAPAIADAAETIRNLIPELRGFQFEPCVCGELPALIHRNDGTWTVNCTCTKFPKVTAATATELIETWNKAIGAKHE